MIMKQLGFQLLNPSETWFPGLGELRKNFASWEWRFGRTPKFSVQKSIQLKSEDQEHDIKVKIDVDKGIIEDINLMLPNDEAIPVVSSLRGTPYMEDKLQGVTDALKGAKTDNMKLAMGL